MSPCSHVSTCPLFGLFTMSATLRVWRQNYCDDEFERCVRFQLGNEGQDVPRNLLPNGKLLNLPPPLRP